MKWICLIAGILCLDAAQAAQEDGKALVQRACTKCHTPDRRHQPAQ